MNTTMTGSIKEGYTPLGKSIRAISQSFRTAYKTSKTGGGKMTDALKAAHMSAKAQRQTEQANLKASGYIRAKASGNPASQIKYGLRQQKPVYVQAAGQQQTGSSRKYYQ